jgi:hypothetical protein
MKTKESAAVNTLVCPAATPEESRSCPTESGWLSGARPSRSVWCGYSAGKISKSAIKTLPLVSGPRISEMTKLIKATEVSTSMGIAKP